MEGMEEIARLEEQVKEQKLTIATLRALGEEAPGPKPISPSSHVSPQLGACWLLFFAADERCACRANGSAPWKSCFQSM